MLAEGKLVKPDDLRAAVLILIPSLLQDRFNRKYHYPYVFLNDEPFSDEFKKYTTGAASGPCSYGLVPKEHWSDTPEWIDQDRAKRAREQMKKDNVMYGESISYR